MTGRQGGTETPQHGTHVIAVHKWKNIIVTLSHFTHFLTSNSCSPSLNIITACKKICCVLLHYQIELLVFLAARLNRASKRISYIENICKVGRDNNIPSVRALCNHRAVTAHCDDPALLRKQSEQTMHLFRDPNILQQPGLGYWFGYLVAIHCVVES